MKKKTTCKLIDIQSVDQITYEDYQLYNSLLTIDKHPILSNWGFGLIALPFLAITVASCFLLPAAIMGLVLGGLVSGLILGGGLYVGLKDLSESKDLIKQYKLLKKNNKLSSLATLMEEYSASDRFKQEKQNHAIASLKDTQASMEQAKAEATKAFETSQVEINKDLTLIQKLIAKLESGATPEEVLNEETCIAIARKKHSLTKMTQYLGYYNEGHAQTSKNEEPTEAKDNTENITGVGI